MFDMMESGGAYVIRWRGSPLLAVESARIFSQDGQEALPPVSYGAGPDGAEICFSGELGRVSLQITTGADSLRFFAGATLGELDPPFAAQRSFPVKQAAELQLRLIGAETSFLWQQHKDWWMQPVFCQNTAQWPARTQAVLLRGRAGFFSLVAPCGEHTRADFAGADADGRFIARLSTNRYGCRRCEGPILVLAAGRAPARCVERAMQAALPPGGRLRTEKTFPAALRGLGWCSWDAFYQQVSAEGLFQKARELNEKHVPVKWMLIDDGWMDTQDKMLRSFQADPEKFPQGLAAVVKRLKEEYGVERVGVWHTLAGYWNGIHPEGPIAAALRDCLCETASGLLIPYPDRARAARFFGAFHAELARCGIDFVKVDSQSSLANQITGDFSYGRASRETLLGLEDSVFRHFGGALVNCMGMAPQEIWGRRDGALSRTSDDFVPQREDGFAIHAMQNAYASLWHGALYWGDWDMFWTEHPQSLRHAVLRAVSGGPVYISDPVGKTDPAALEPLTLSDGTLLCCDAPATPSPACLTADPRASGLALKLRNHCGGAAVIAAFHVGEAGQKAVYTLSARDFSEDCACCAAYDCLRESVLVLRQNDGISLSLPPNGAAVYSLAAVRDGFAAFGPRGKYLPRAARMEEETANGSSGLEKRLLLWEGGAFAFYARHRPETVLANGSPVALRDAGGGLYFAGLPVYSGRKGLAVVIKWPVTSEE